MTTATASAPSLGAARRPSWFAQALVVLRKDLAIELSTGEVVVSSGFFASWW